MDTTSAAGIEVGRPWQPENPTKLHRTLWKNNRDSNQLLIEDHIGRFIFIHLFVYFCHCHLYTIWLLILRNLLVSNKEMAVSTFTER